MKDDSPYYLVTYVHIQIDDPSKLDSPDLYFGGLVSNMNDAEVLARSCSQNLKNGTIIPKILRFEGYHLLLDMMYDAAEKFQVVFDQMKEMHLRMTNIKKKKTKKPKKK